MPACKKAIWSSLCYSATGSCIWI